MKNLIYEWIIFQEDEIILVREKQMAESKHLSNFHNIPKDPQERIDWRGRPVGGDCQQSNIGTRDRKRSGIIFV